MRIVASFLDRIRLLGAAKGTTVAAEATVSTIDADHNALDVRVQGTTATSNAILDVATGIANNATVPSRAVQTGGISSDTEPALVSAGRLAFGWVRRNGALMIGALGRNATAIASATNGVPVYPEDSSEWTAKQGTAAAVNAPWYVRLSDGASAVGVALDSTLAAMSAKLPAVLGQTTAALSLAVAQARAIGLSLATVATTGEVIKATGGAIYWCSFTQTTGSTVYVQVHDLAAGPVSAGRRPEWVSSGTFVSGTSSQSLPIGHTTEGAVCNDGIVIVFSTTQYTFTAPAGNTATMRVIYR